jgi:F0F1-type ATP synthase membrane subunit a
MIPGKAQNLFEVIVSGIEEFMVETAGEEARWLFPTGCHAISSISFIGNLIGIIPGFLPPTANLNTTESCAHCGGGVHPYHRCEISWRRLTSNIFWGRSGGWHH